MNPPIGVLCWLYIVPSIDCEGELFIYGEYLNIVPNLSTKLDWLINSQRVPNSHTQSKD